ncbi:MAG: VPLPA-CTERM-specific exosortase XrtD [Sulfuricella sp.]
MMGFMLTALLFASVAAGFWPVLTKLIAQWNNEDNSYCYLIVPIFLYLCHEKRHNFRFQEFTWSPWALAPALLGVSLAAAGELGSAETLTYLGIWCMALGIGVMLYGTRIRLLRFPFFILLFAVPLPPYLSRTLTFKLKMLASSFSVGLLRLSGVSVAQDGNIIDLGIDQLQVVDACSGLRYVMPMVLLALLIGHFFVKKGAWRKWTLLVMVLPLAVLINSLRIFVTGLLYVNGKPELAQNFFHDFAGLVIFLGAGGALFLTATALNRFGPLHCMPEKKDPGGRPFRLALSGALALVLCTLFVGSGWALQRLPHTQILPERATFADFPMEIAGWQGRRDYISKEILAQLWADDYVKGVFTNPKNPGQLIHLLIPYYEYQGNQHTAHAPQSCLLGSGWAILESKEREVAVAADRKITIRTMFMKNGDNTMIGSYFFLNRGRVITNPWLNKFYIMLDAFTKRRTDGALVRVEMQVPNGQPPEKAYEDLDRFIGGLWRELPAYIPG